MPEQPHDFVHLHVHTEFSLLDGLSQIKRLVNRAAEMKQSALAITDHGTMFGVIDFYRACKAAGIKPIIGLEAYLARRTMQDRDPEKDARPYHLLLLAKNDTGYKNLLKIASAAQLEGHYYRPRIDRDFLAGHAEGLIGTSGCLAAEIPRMVELGREDEALRLIGWYQDVFGKENFFLELQHHNIPQLHTLNQWLRANQEYAEVPFVATNDVHYVLDSDYDAHDTLLCIQTGNVKAEQNRLRFTSPTFHLRSQEEMWRLFAEVPEALSNTLLVADMCDVNLDSSGYHLPVFPVPEGHTAETYLRFLCERGLKWRYQDRADDPAIENRLHHELKIIHDMGFDTYFLIVWDLCEFARHADIWWNVRGSGAGSVAAYSLGITNIDPLRNGLIFERFLNPGRVSMPDIDLDYPEDRRAEMIQYCAQKYGEDKVAAIITFGTMGSKAAIRDVGRALDMPLPEVDRIARLIPSGAKPVKFKDALGDDPEKALPDLKKVYANDTTAKTLIDTAKQLEGITRHASTHAAGVIVADKPLIEYLPLHRPTKGSAEDAPVKMVTQFPMETCESIGLLKVDFLGLSTLTIMRRACELIERYHGVKYDLSTIPYRPDPDDPEKTHMVEETFEMLGRGETIGVFQLESQGMRRMLTDMRPKMFEHIVAGIALYRPGPMEYIPQYNRRLHGAEKIEYKHDLLRPILEETYGIIVYQESILQIGAELFGYSLGEADLMRRAVSKKKKEDLLKHRQIFVERGPEHGVDPDTASKIFDDIEFFARYGFNKCLVGDTLIVDAETGRRVRIGDLADGTATIEHTVTLETDSLQLRSGAVTQVMENGIKPVYKLTTHLGRTITATANHPLYTRDGWRTLGELSVDDQIAVPHRIPVENPREWTEDQITAMVEALDLVDLEATLPDEVFELTEAQIAVLLARLWDQHGWVITSQSKCMTFVDTRSERLAGQIQRFLARLGITSRVNVHMFDPPDLTHPPFLGVLVRDAENMRIFADQIMPYMVDESRREKIRRGVSSFVASTPPLYWMERGQGGEVSGDIYWDSIVSIRYAGEEMTYDLTVPDTHNFVANDIIVHNSHAADYAVLTCQTAFLKCHYPHEYMAALMSVHRDDSGKVSLFAADCARMDIAVLPPTVNDSQLDFSIQNMPDGSRAIRFGLGAVKNVGVGPLEHVIEQREKGGPFTDLDDFCRRVDTRILNKRPMESLIKVGALDEFGERYVLLAALDRIISFSADHHKAQDVGQMSLFGEATGVEFGAEQSILGSLHDVIPVPQREMLNWEKELVGLYVTDHPLKPIMDQLQEISSHTTAELEELGDRAQDRPVTIAGLVAGLRRFTTKNGDMMAVATIEDITGQISAVLFPRTWGTYRDVMDEDAVVIVRGKADASRGEMQIIVDSVTQDVALYAAAGELPDLAARSFSWLDDATPPDTPDDDGEEDDTDTDDDDLYDEETGEVVSAEPAEDAPILNTEPVMPASGGASANVPAPPIEPAQVIVPAPKPSPRETGLVTDREMPGWLEDEMDNGWSPPPDFEYHEDTGYLVGVREPEAEEDTPAVDAAGRLTPPPAPAARTRDQVEPVPERDETQPRESEPTPDAMEHRVSPPPRTPEPTPEPEPGRLLTLFIARTGDSARDRRRVQRLHGILIEFPGHDHFRFVIEGGGKKAAVMAFPNHPIRINDEMLSRVATLIGEQNIEIGE